MSIVDDQIRRFDTYLDRCQLASAHSQTISSHEDILLEPNTLVPGGTGRSVILKNAIRALSVTSSSNPLLRRRRLRNLLLDIQGSTEQVQAHADSNIEDLEWLATGKAAVQVYGVMLQSLLNQTIPLNESVWYWDNVLGSYVRTSLYMLQTSPLRLFDASREIYRDAGARYQSRFSLQDAAEHSARTFSQGWQEFYQLIRRTIRDRSLVQARSRVLTPFAISRTEARRKQEQLVKLRGQGATAIGLLVDEGLSFPQDEEGPSGPNAWRFTVLKSVSLLEGLLHHAHDVEGSISDYENNVFETVDAADQSEDHPARLATKLLHILEFHLPKQEQSSKIMAIEFGMPPRWVRYWIPGAILLFSGGTLLRIFANRRAEVQTWVRDLGQTAIDFWLNWVIEPARRLIGTIRHDENAELAIMSRDSLRSDRESLERMVVDFAIENPDGGRSYTQPEVAEIRSKVKEGDLTPVLRAYEQDMKSPIVRAVTGNLIRTLLIQIQKTKVDVEVAISGIDSLLKSQQLLFGFVGIAPGILVSYFLGQWVRGFFGGRRGTQEAQRQGESVRLVRNIDRILTNSVPTPQGLLSYKDHGLLICEVHVLRQKATRALPGRIQREFLEDISDLMSVGHGIDKQRRALQRIRWAYSKWLG